MSDYPYQDKYTPIIRQDRRKPDYSLDFLSSEDLDELEEGIKETIQGVDTANLVVAIAIAKIDKRALYIQAGYKSYLEYLDKAQDRLNMSRQTISDYKRIGETYIQYKNELQKAGFKEEGNLHKLRFLQRALERHRPGEVFPRLTKDSLRKFIDYATVDSSDRSDSQPVPQYIPDIKITDHQIIVDGHNILRFTKDLDERAKKELAVYLKRIYEVRATGNTPYILDIYDQNEARAVESFLRRRRAKK